MTRAQRSRYPMHTKLLLAAEALMALVRAYRTDARDEDGQLSEQGRQIADRAEQACRRLLELAQTLATEPKEKNNEQGK